MLCHARKTLAALAMTGICGLAIGSDGTGLTVNPDNLNWPRWQGRLSLTTPVQNSGNGAPQIGNQTPSPSLSLMTDYYLTGSLLGPRRAGGFRATGGVMMGPRGQAWAGPLPGSQGNAFNVQRRVFGQSPTVLPGDASNESSTLPYVGLGYTGLSPRGGWSFSADLGLVSTSAGGIKLGRAFSAGQTLDDPLRDSRWSPMLQLGVSYSF